MGEICNLLRENNPPCYPSDCGTLGPCVILPGEEKLITFDLLTPTKDEIVNIKTQEKVDFRVSYNFDGSLLYTVPVVNMDEIINRQRQGERTQVQISKAHGSGPMQIDVELFGAPYILSGYSATFLFNIKNRGSWVLTDKNEIYADDFVIEFPSELINGKLIAPGDDEYSFLGNAPINLPYFLPTSGMATTQPQDTQKITQPVQQKMFNCEYIPSSYVVKCTNTQPIPVYKDETRTSLRFEIPRTIDFNLMNYNQPFKSYEIRAYLRYRYEMRESVDIVINPFGNV